MTPYELLGLVAIIAVVRVALSLRPVATVSSGRSTSIAKEYLDPFIYAGIAAWLLITFVAVFGLGKIALLGVVAVALLLAYEHSLVSAHDLSRLNAAFFTMNGVIAVVFFLFVATDLLWRR